MSTIQYDTSHPVVVDARSVVAQFKTFRATEAVLDIGNTAYLAGRVYAVIEAYGKLPPALQTRIILPWLFLSLYAECIEGHDASSDDGIPWKLRLHTVRYDDPRTDQYEYLRYDYFASGRLTPDRELAPPAPLLPPPPPAASLTLAANTNPHVLQAQASISPTFTTSPTIAAPTPISAIPQPLPTTNQDLAVVGADGCAGGDKSKPVRSKRRVKVRAVGPVTRGSSVEKTNDGKQPNPDAGQPRPPHLLCDYCRRRNFQCVVADTGNCCRVCTASHYKCTVAGKPVEVAAVPTQEVLPAVNADVGMSTRSRAKRDVVTKEVVDVKMEESVLPMPKVEPVMKNKSKRKANAVTQEAPEQLTQAVAAIGEGPRADKRRRVVKASEPSDAGAVQSKAGCKAGETHIKSTGALVNEPDTRTLIRPPLSVTIYERMEERVRELEGKWDAERKVLLQEVATLREDTVSQEVWNTERKTVLQEVSSLRQDIVSLRQENERVTAAMFASRLQQNFTELQTKYDALLAYVKHHISGQPPTPLLHFSNMGSTIPLTPPPNIATQHLVNRPPLQIPVDPLHGRSTPTLTQPASIESCRVSPLLRDLDLLSSGSSSVLKMELGSTSPATGVPATHNSPQVNNSQP